LQVLDNLLTNAVKFSSAESPVLVTLEDPGVDVLRVHVADDGIGIAPDDLAKLFQPFSRVGKVPGRAKGSGLGLFIARSLVEGQGGTIEVASELGAGTRFSYTVPVATQR
ncbi:MAG: ATP-binding protein, partial [Nitriliruptor sp.]